MPFYLALNAAPLLGVRGPKTGDVVPPETADELDRLTNDKATKLATIYVFGGPAGVSDKVAGDLAAWAPTTSNASPAENRFGTMEAISPMLPTKAKDSDLLDGMDSSDLVAPNDVLFAVVELDGTFVSGDGAIDATRTGLGTYVVTFDRNLEGCARTATAGQPGEGPHAGHIGSTELVDTSDAPRTPTRSSSSSWNGSATQRQGHPFHLSILS